MRIATYRSPIRWRTAMVAIVLLAAGAAMAQDAVLRVSNPFPLGSLDPHGTNALNIGTVTAARHLFDTLVKWQDGELVPNLATGWTNPDDTTWAFDLRDDVTFHDGTPVTAHDVRASIERIVELGGPAAPLFQPITAIEVPSDHELVLTTATPLGTMLVNLSRVFVAPAASMNDEGFFQNPVGSGPFVFESLALDDRLVLRANAAYWGGAPQYDELVFVEIPEVSTRLTALSTGEIDVTWLIPADQLESVRATPGVQLEAIPSYASYVIWFNPNHEHLADARVRRAIWHAINFPQIVEDLYTGVGTLAKAPVTPAVFGYAEQEPVEYDPELARQLLTEAGYPDGFTVQLQWRDTEYTDLVFAIISDLARVGIEVAPTQKEHAIWLQDLLALDWEINLMIQSAASGDADWLLGRLYTCAANRIGYCNPALDDILVAARTSLDQDVRRELYAEASEIIWNEAVGMFPIDLTDTYAFRDRVQGFRPDPSQAPSFYSVTLDR